MIVCQPLKSDFTVLNNALLRDERLSIEATAVMAWLLSKPRNWVVQVEQLRKRFRCGRERMQRVMRELIACGWVQRRPARAVSGSTFAGSEYVVFNVPQPVQEPLAPQASAEPDEAEHAGAVAGETAAQDVARESDYRATGIPTPYQERTLPRTDSSEPDGSGTGPPAPTGKALLFSEGRPSLMALGVPYREAGALIGRWLRDTGDDAGRVLQTIRRAREHVPHDPIPWITAHLEPRSSHVRESRNDNLRPALDGLADRLRAMA